MIRIAILSAGLLAGTASVAGAGPGVGSNLPEGVNNSVVQVHGNHRACRFGPGGWHRHNRFGEWRPCREWRGGGPRPDSCVRVGPIWFCDY